jgi:hypothetical protein
MAGWIGLDWILGYVGKMVSGWSYRAVLRCMASGHGGLAAYGYPIMSCQLDGKWQMANGWFSGRVGRGLE